MQQVTNLKYSAAEIRENLGPTLKVENVSSNCATMDGNREAVPVENHFQIGRLFGIFRLTLSFLCFQMVTQFKTITLKESD